MFQSIVAVRVGGALRRAIQVLWFCYMTVERVKVLGRIGQDLLQAAFGNGNAGQLGDGLDRFQERVLHGGLDQAPLEFVRERARGQGQSPIERRMLGEPSRE